MHLRVFKALSIFASPLSSFSLIMGPSLGGTVASFPPHSSAPFPPARAIGITVPPPTGRRATPSRRILVGVRPAPAASSVGRPPAGSTIHSLPILVAPTAPRFPQLLLPPTLFAHTHFAVLLATTARPKSRIAVAENTKQVFNANATVAAFSKLFEILPGMAWRPAGSDFSSFRRRV
eukprot:GHVT01064677.1.p2 GENE.GHVT01064677.1~~GHVT01064677.1.p2  ORF type:complete len:177 (-),score=31.49 GHVT01064677.1:13-543(-)